MLLIGSIILILICAVGILKYVFIYIKKNKSHQLQVVKKPSTREYKVKNKTIATKVSSNALKVISNLLRHGYQAYLVGGCIRDILLDITPKDFDIVTDATPEQILKLFRNARLIGRRFKLIHVTFGRDIIEVATFRATNLTTKYQTESGRLLFDNNYGTIEEDAVRRDFTINAIYYDYQTSELIDFCNGIDDLDRSILKIIGNAATRYQEDPVRMIRAIKFSCRLNISIEEQTQAHIPITAHLLDDVPPGRKYNEIVKLLYTGCVKNIFDELIKFDLFRYLFPASHRVMQEDEIHRKIVNQALINTDIRINNERGISPAFMFSVLLWHPMKRLTDIYAQDGMPYAVASQQAAKQIIAEQITHTSIPKYFTQAIRDIWDLQNKMENRKVRQIKFVLAHSRFRAALDFLLIRESVGDIEQICSKWWDKIHYANEKSQNKMIADLKKTPNKKKKK